MVYICKAMEEITQRLKVIMEENGLSSSQMADKIGVQRSAISHVLSGRNKPSLDFILKVLKSFPNVSSEWLLKGQNSAKKKNDFSEVKLDVLQGDKSGQISSKKVMEKVLIFYTDKTVEEYKVSIG